jgi:glycopeptide antibiotics resistance protein
LRLTGYRTLFVFWIVVIFAIVVPWGSFQPHAHWQKIGWVPFVTAPIRLRDIVLNTLLFVPFGYWSAKAIGGAWWQTAALAFALSVGAEFAQVFSHGRFPSATDVACNTAGAIWGGLWARR